jgi:hypothetical protein
LRQATTEPSVVELVRVYLDTWSPAEIGKLPPAAWPGPMSTGRDLVGVALKVAQLHSSYEGPRESLALLQELLLFLTQASVRVRQVMPTGSDPEPAMPASHPSPNGKVPVKGEE